MPSKRHTLQKRVKTTIRVDAELWRAFMEKLQGHHLSTCLALEGLMSAYVYGGSLVPGQTGPQVVNVTIEREEIRPRRREDEEYVRKKKATNHYADGVWFYDPELEPGEIVVEQPEEWGRNRCAEGFTWVEGRQLWWKKD